MALLASLSIKQKDGSFKNYTISVSDDSNQFGQNVSMYEEQTKEEREAKTPRKYIGNGKVYWTDGTVKVGEKKESSETPKIYEEPTDLPF